MLGGPARAVNDPEFIRFIDVIGSGDDATATRLLDASPQLAGVRCVGGATRQAATDWWIDEIGHYLNAGDTLLHIVAAAYAAVLVPRLVALGADVHAANRRDAHPLHYAVDGGPGNPRFDPEAQRATIGRLLGAGADPNAADKGGTTPLHRAVRNRCAGAVEVLLVGGADPLRDNGRGSTPMKLAGMTRGRGGSGSPAAEEQQAEIVRLLAAYGAPPDSRT
jgi:ankyrin repeat protein